MSTLEIWERARRGQHTVALGFTLADAPQDLRVVRVSCDVPQSTLGPLLEARARIERVLGTRAALVEYARSRVLTGLRRHLLGDLPSAGGEGSLVEVCNRLAALEPAVLVLEVADAADPASLDMLRHILARPGWLRLPVVLAMRAGPLPAAAVALVDAVRDVCGDDAIVGPAAAPHAAPVARAAPGAAPEPSSQPTAAAPEPSSQPAVAPDPRALPADVLRVLRALAIAGSGCEVQLLAAALETTELAVLDALQRAADAGVPIGDRGEGRFHLPEPLIAALRATILPSLATALHQRVAGVLAKEDVPLPSPVPALQVEPAAPPPDEGPRPGNAWEVMQAERSPDTLRLPGIDEPPTTASAERAAPQTQPLPRSQPEPRAEPEAQAELALQSQPELQAEPEPRSQPSRRAQSEPQPAEVTSPASAQPSAARSFEESAARFEEEAEREAFGAVIEAREHIDDAEAARRMAAESAAHPDDDAVEHAAEDAAERAAEEATAHAAHEARLAADAAAAKDAAARKAAEEAAAHAVEHAQRELSDEAALKQGFYKPFTGDQPTAPEPSFATESAPRGNPARARWVTAQRAEPQGPARARPEARLQDNARAARHLAAAGEAEPAIEGYLEAMRKAVVAAAYPQAVAHATSALALLDRLPPTERRRLQRVQILLEIGRVLWHGAGPDDSFKLPGALRVLESARASLHAGDPAELLADVATTIAGVLHEIGDLQSLTRALDELASAARALAESGQPQAAARLFNDQAAVFIRLGDPVRAAHLLTESRKIFEEPARTDPIAMVEMAETDHLFARILLHVPARPGREDDALSLGLDHALAAERAFRRLGAPREVGRVLETMGRLELRKGRLPRAAERITAAVKLQESIGDVVGLAGSTASLSEVLAAGGRVREALSLLADSIVLNFEKGSPLGLAFNRRALQALAQKPAAQDGAADLLDEVAARLAAAEKVLGRIPIPGTADAAS